MIQAQIIHPPTTHPIAVTHNHYRALPKLLQRLHLDPVGVLITNRHVRRAVGPHVLPRLQQAGWRIRVIEVPDTERSKTMATAVQVVRTMAPKLRGHVPTLFALGGGVIGDLTGFIASIYRRGIPYVHLPTTLLAQVDSSVGGKVGVDLPQGKNLLGSFYHPQAVMADVCALRTLPVRQLRTGLAEVIKYGAILDPTLWRYLARHHRAIQRCTTAQLAWIVRRCAALKVRIVAQDARDTTGCRALLNFGHTVGHAIEAACAYSQRMTHGESIAVGMAVALDIGVAIGLTPTQVRDEVLARLDACGLPTRMQRISLPKVRRALTYDKKRVSGQQRWILLSAIGHAVVMRGVPQGIVEQSLQDRLGGRRG